MKSYTDLEQSKKLAEILPLESADMWWLYVPSQGKHIAMMYEEPDPHYLVRMEMYGIKDAAIPCWSLAALLDAIPVITEYNGTSIRLRIDKGHIGDDEYAIWYEDLQTNLSTDIEAEADNFIDACYKMILKLHELNIL